MGYWNDLKQKMANPPPERLAAIEYRSHFMQMIGVTVVCVILILRGLWFVIFAFIFSIGISYSQGVTAYQKYQMIKSMSSPEPVELIKSPTRKRGRIITEVWGSKPNYVVALITAVSTIAISNRYYSDVHFLIYTLLFVITLIFIYIMTYYFPCYWLANYFYKKKKGETKNGKEKTS